MNAECPTEGELQFLRKFKRSASLNAFNKTKWEPVVGGPLDAAVERLTRMGLLAPTDPRIAIARGLDEGALRDLFEPGCVPASAKKAKLISLVLAHADTETLAHILKRCAAYVCTPAGSIASDEHHEKQEVQKRADQRRYTLEYQQRRLVEIKRNADIFPYVEWVADEGYSCPSCEKLHGKFFDIYSLPAFPNPACTCEDGCRCMLFSHTEEDYWEELARRKTEALRTEQKLTDPPPPPAP